MQADDAAVSASVWRNQVRFFNLLAVLIVGGWLGIADW